MVEVGEFNTLVIDERRQNVRFGPTAGGIWIEIDGWGAQEWDALVLLAERSSGDPPALVQYANRRVNVNRKVVFRIRERFRRQFGIPRDHADSVIVTNRNTSGIFLNPRIKARFFPPRRTARSDSDGPRALDSMLHAITRATFELFGEGGLQKAVALLPDDARHDTIEERHLPGRWIPVRYITNWMRAVHAGPAALATDAFEAFVRKVEGYRVSPYFVDYVRCHRSRLLDIRHLWRTCYDTGDFEASHSAKNDFLELRLWNHPHCENERARRTFALCWRALAEVFGVHEPWIETCELEALTGALRIRIGGDFSD